MIVVLGACRCPAGAGHLNIADDSARGWPATKANSVINRAGRILHCDGYSVRYRPIDCDVIVVDLNVPGHYHLSVIAGTSTTCRQTASWIRRRGAPDGNGISRRSALRRVDRA